MGNRSPEAEQPKIPSKFGKKEGANAKVRVSESCHYGNLDIAASTIKVTSSSGFPEEAFRVLEDGTPQIVSSFGIGEGPMTVTMVIEFSNLYQRYWTETWYLTLTAAYGFLETLKSEDFVAVVAYDLRPEILSDFSTNKQKATKQCSACASQPSPNPTSSMRWWILGADERD